MYNRYKGNSGKVIRVEEQKSEPKPAVQRHAPQRSVQKKAPPLFDGSLQKLLGKSFAELETEDLMLLLILYLMYRESGNKELLMIMGAMYLL